MTNAIITNYIKFLEELDESSLLIAGGKGANLGVLINAGLPVPPGFTVTAAAYRVHIQNSGLVDRIRKRLEGLSEQDITALSSASHDISGWIESSPMPEEIQSAISAAYQGLSERTHSIKNSAPNLSVAVRSSATAEDLPSASFAGQQETYLGIRGTEALLAHVKKCWASLWTPQAISYRISMGFEHMKVDLAVVVQSMLAADAAGVMFTANPVTGAAGEILISASYGLGEAVVSGLVTPDTFIVTKNGTVKERTLGSKEQRIMLIEAGTTTEAVENKKRSVFCLSDTHLMQLLKLAKLVEAHYGKPQDTEWALVGEKIYLLQARPITTTADSEANMNVLEPGDEILWKGKKPPFGIKDLMEHFVEPMPPLDMDMYCMGDRAFQRMFKNLGMGMSKKPTSTYERSSGCVAINMEQSRLSPALLWKLPANLYETSHMNPLDRWRPLEKEINNWLKEMKAKEKDISDPHKLAIFIQQAISDYEEFGYRRFVAVFTASMISDMRVSAYIKKAAGKASVNEIKPKLFRALQFRTAKQNQAIAGLAQAAAANGKQSAQFKAAFDEFVMEYGARPALGMIPFFSIPTWSEKPETIMSLVDALSADSESLNWQAAYKKQESDYSLARKQVETALKPSDRRKFLDHLEKARNGIIIREESLFIMEKIVAFLRITALRFGKLLCERNIINETEDVFFLFLKEFEAAAKEAAGIKEKVEKRKQTFIKVYAAHEKGQHWMITTGTIAPLETYKKDKKEKAAEAKDSSALKGLAASRGEFEGTVCIVRGPHEFSKLKKGDILVAPFTAPIWTPLFRVASAVVTEIGSPVSHAAIVAREYGIPAVVAVDNATSILKDGQRIRVDGTKGVVTIIQ